MPLGIYKYREGIINTARDIKIPLGIYKYREGYINTPGGNGSSLELGPTCPGPRSERGSPVPKPKVRSPLLPGAL